MQSVTFQIDGCPNTSAASSSHICWIRLATSASSPTNSAAVVVAAGAAVVVTSRVTVTVSVADRRRTQPDDNREDRHGETPHVHDSLLDLQLPERVAVC